MRTLTFERTTDGALICKTGKGSSFRVYYKEGDASWPLNSYYWEATLNEGHMEELIMAYELEVDALDALCKRLSSKFNSTIKWEVA